MTSRESYIKVKQRDLEELESKVTSLSTQPSADVTRLRDACQSASSALDRIVSSDNATWHELQTVVDGAFRHAYDCLRQISSQ